MKQAHDRQADVLNPAAFKRAVVANAMCTCNVLQSQVAGGFLMCYVTNAKMNSWDPLSHLCHQLPAASGFEKPSQTYSTCILA